MLCLSAMSLYPYECKMWWLESECNFNFSLKINFFYSWKWKLKILSWSVVALIISHFMTCLFIKLVLLIPFINTVEVMVYFKRMQLDSAWWQPQLLSIQLSVCVWTYKHQKESNFWLGFWFLVCRIDWLLWQLQLYQIRPSAMHLNTELQNIDN